jgi:uncharacterized membrane protein YphA (DoxX/SURF4 family)
MLLRRLARPMLAGIFISGGIAALRDPEGHAKAAGPVLDQVSGLVPMQRPPSSVTLVKADAAVKIGAGVLLATGKAPRLAATALAASLIPTTAAGHRFWEIEDPQQRTEHQIHFMKNLALLGGLMLASADTEGKPSLSWRARSGGRTSTATAELFHRDVTQGIGELSQRVSALSEQVADRVTGLGGQVVEVAGRYGPQAAQVVSEAGERITDLAGRYGPQAVGVAGQVGDRLSDRTGLLRDEAHKLGTRAARRAEKAASRARKTGNKARKRAAHKADRVRSLVPS